MIYLSVSYCARLINFEHLALRFHLLKKGFFSTFHRTNVGTNAILQTICPNFSPICCTLRIRIDKNLNVAKQSVTCQRVLKVAIIGVPNAGKSTLINSIVGRNIFAVSSKVHTTRCRARAVMVVEQTQLIFLDTPGLVTIKESVKHHLERSFIVDGLEAVKEADVIGVIHDVSNKYTMLQLDPKVLRLLLMFPQKHAFLILNKIDKLKSKRALLDCVNSLTEGRGALEKDNVANILNVNESGVSSMPENDIQAVISYQTGWPLFKSTFMISALSGNGVGDIQFYLMDLAKPGKWLFDGSTVTDQKEVDVVEQTVFAKLLDHLPNVIPYELEVALEYFNKTEDGAVTTVVMIYTKKEKILKLVMGKGGCRIRRVAADVEQCLRQFFLNDIHVKLILEVKDPEERIESKRSS